MRRRGVHGGRRRARGRLGLLRAPHVAHVRVEVRHLVPHLVHLHITTTILIRSGHQQAMYVLDRRYVWLFQAGSACELRSVYHCI